jgi:hypothetical protein
MIDATLHPHPDRPPSASFDLSASVSIAGARLSVTYRLTGPIDRLKLPPPAPSTRRDELWRHTCFELFARDTGPAYAEFNFAPSTDWAAYAFDNYRAGMRPLDITPPALNVTRTDSTLTLEATIQLLSRPRTLALTAVIEETDGRISYWSLAHPDGAPDFHHPRCFVLDLPSAD